MTRARIEQAPAEIRLDSKAYRVQVRTTATGLTHLENISGQVGKIGVHRGKKRRPEER
jgi:hypothetical protein